VSNQVDHAGHHEGEATDNEDGDEPADGEVMTNTTPSEPTPSRAFYITGVLLLVFTVLLLPVALGSIVVTLFLPAEAEVYFLTEAPPSPASATSQREPADYLNIAVVAIDEAKGVATLRVSGNRSCTVDCDPLDVVLFSMSGALARRVGLPPSATIALPAGGRQINASAELPVSGNPSLYPFDTYELVLGVTLQATRPDGTISVVSPATHAGPAYLTLQSQVQRMSMVPPLTVDPASVSAEANHNALLSVRTLKFFRPLYLPMLAVLLVALIAGTAFYSVRTQPVRALLLGVGSLVLGVWGIRGILVPGFPPYVTAVDLALSVVILLLLAGIIARGVLEYRRARRRSPTVS
jgi:hypothetical protein